MFDVYKAVKGQPQWPLQEPYIAHKKVSEPGPELWWSLVLVAWAAFVIFYH